MVKLPKSVADSRFAGGIPPTARTEMNPAGERHPVDRTSCPSAGEDVGQSYAFDLSHGQ
jgi:hypothetical protein